MTDSICREYIFWSLFACRLVADLTITRHGFLRAGGCLAPQHISCLPFRTINQVHACICTCRRPALRPAPARPLLANTQSHCESNDAQHRTPRIPRTREHDTEAALRPRVRAGFPRCDHTVKLGEPRDPRAEEPQDAARAWTISGWGISGRSPGLSLTASHSELGSQSHHAGPHLPAGLQPPSAPGKMHDAPHQLGISPSQTIPFITQYATPHLMQAAKHPIPRRAPTHMPHANDAITNTPSTSHPAPQHASTSQAKSQTTDLTFH